MTTRLMKTKVNKLTIEDFDFYEEWTMGTSTEPRTAYVRVRNRDNDVDERAATRIAAYRQIRGRLLAAESESLRRAIELRISQLENPMGNLVAFPFEVRPEETKPLAFFVDRWIADVELMEAQGIPGLRPQIEALRTMIENTVYGHRLRTPEIERWFTKSRLHHLVEDLLRHRSWAQDQGYGWVAELDTWIGAAVKAIEDRLSPRLKDQGIRSPSIRRWIDDQKKEV